MNLGDRRGGDRFGKIDIEFIDRPAERQLDLGARLGGRERRHAILKRSEIERHVMAHHVRTRRQELAELDVGRSEPLHGTGDPFGAVAPLAARARQCFCDPPAEFGRTLELVTRQGCDHALANENPAGPSQPQIGSKRTHASRSLKSSSPNGQRRRRRCSRAMSRARSRHGRSSMRNRADWETCGSTRPDSGRARRRR